MDNIQKKEKKIGVKLILGWIFGLLLIYFGANNLFKDPITGIFGILAALVVFPPSIQFLKNKTGVNLSPTLRIVLFFVLMGITISFSSNTDKTSNSQIAQTNTKISKPTPTPTPIVLAMPEFIDEYAKNKVSVQSKYTAKRLQFTGFIENISSSWDQYYLELAPTNDQYYWGTTIKCYFVNKAVLVDFSKGQSVSVVGTLRDTSYESWIELHDCSSIK